MKPVAIVQHDPHDGPSYFATWLTRQGIAWELLPMFDGAALPANLSGYAGLAILGGSMSANDPMGYYPHLLHLIRQAVQDGTPVIGHCLGGQLLSRALGGTVGPAAHKEIGWCSLEPVHPLAAAWFGAQPLRLFQWHGESFSIPARATPLLRGRLCHNQAYVVNGLHLGMQFHCEVDEAKLRSWLTVGMEEMRSSSASPGVQAAAAILETLASDVARSQAIADHIYSRWAQGLR